MLLSYLLMSKAMRNKMIFLVALACYGLTFLEPAENIDTAGHVGGLVCGLIAGGIWFIVSSSRKRKSVNADEGSV